MIVVDAHCDTLTKVYDTGVSLYSNDYNLDVKRMGGRGNYVQFFAAFVHPKLYKGYEMKRAVELIDKFYKDYDICNDNIMLCCNYKEIINAIRKNKVAAVLSIEGGEALQGSLSSLRMFYKLGVRSICLTWNYKNEIGYGVLEDPIEGKLSDFGVEVVREMNRLGMLIDLSHISRRCFNDVITLSRHPVILSHSNAKAVCNHKRNLTNDQIHAVKQNEGVIGINFYPDFISIQDGLTVSGVIKHIEHIIELIGDDYIGIGADYDQDEPVFEGIDGIKFTDNVLEGLLRMNYAYKTVEKIAGLNFLRVIKKVLG